jgi:hypothetical protein
MYVLDYFGGTWAATDVPNGDFISTGSAPVDSANDYGPSSAAYDQSDNTMYALEWSAYGRRIERVDPSTGRRWGSVQINEPEGNDWITAIAVAPGGQFYGLGDQGGLYSITLGATNATLHKIGMTGITASQTALAYDPHGFGLYAFDQATGKVRWLNLSDASTIASYTTSGLPTLGTGQYPLSVVSMAIDTNGQFWLNVQNPNGISTESYVGTPSGSSLALVPNGYWKQAASQYGNVVAGAAMVIAPPIDTTTVAHAQSAGTVIYGGAVKVSMTATDTTTHTALAGVGAQLQRWTGSAWVGVKNVTTSSAGSAAFTFVPTISTNYRWYASGRTAAHDYYVAVSSAFAVKVALKAATPTISGTVRHGTTLTAHPGTWAPSGIAFAYQWYLNGVVVKGATKPTLALGSGAIGRRVSVRVTGSKTGYVAVGRTSAATVPVG